MWVHLSNLYNNIFSKNRFVQVLSLPRSPALDCVTLFVSVNVNSCHMLFIKEI